MMLQILLIPLHISSTKEEYIQNINASIIKNSNNSDQQL